MYLLHSCTFFDGDFIEEIQTLVTEKFQFQYRDDSILSTVFGVFGQPRFLTQVTESTIYNGLVCCNLNCFDWDLGGENEASVFEELKYLRFSKN